MFSVVPASLLPEVQESQLDCDDGSDKQLSVQNQSALRATDCHGSAAAKFHAFFQTLGPRPFHECVRSQMPGS